MPVGVRTHGRGPPKRVVPRTVPRNPRAHFRAQTSDVPLRPITQAEVDAAVADAPRAIEQYHRSQAGRDDVRMNEQAVRNNRREYGEPPLAGVPHDDRRERPYTPGSN